MINNGDARADRGLDPTKGVEMSLRADHGRLWGTVVACVAASCLLVAVPLATAGTSSVATASPTCTNYTGNNPCNWNTDTGDSPDLLSTDSGDHNFSINVTAGAYFMGCYLGTAGCQPEVYIQTNTTGPLIRDAGAGDQCYCADVYAAQDTGGYEDTTLYHPYP